MINKEVIVSIQLSDINNLISLEHEEIGCGYNNLTEGTDYEVLKGTTSWFIQITKELDCGKDHHLKIKVNQSADGTDVEWITCFKPKGKSQRNYCNTVT